MIGYISELEKKAHGYWQNELSKLFTAKGPTNCEVEMFCAGYELAKKELAQSQDSDDEGEEF